MLRLRSSQPCSTHGPLAHPLTHHPHVQSIASSFQISPASPIQPLPRVRASPLSQPSCDQPGSVNSMFTVRVHSAPHGDCFPRPPTSHPQAPACLPAPTLTSHGSASVVVAGGIASRCYLPLVPLTVFWQTCVPCCVHCFACPPAGASHLMRCFQALLHFLPISRGTPACHTAWLRPKKLTRCPKAHPVSKSSPCVQKRTLAYPASKSASCSQASSCVQAHGSSSSLAIVSSPLSRLPLCSQLYFAVGRDGRVLLVR